MTVVCCWKRCCLIGVWISMIDRRRWRRWYDDAVGARSRWFMVRERETMWCGRSLTMLLMCTGIVRWTRAIERITLVQSSIFTSICVIPRSTTRVGAVLRWLLDVFVHRVCVCVYVAAMNNGGSVQMGGYSQDPNVRTTTTRVVCSHLMFVCVCVCVCSWAATMAMPATMIPTYSSVNTQAVPKAVCCSFIATNVFLLVPHCRLQSNWSRHTHCHATRRRGRWRRFIQRRFIQRRFIQRRFVQRRFVQR